MAAYQVIHVVTVRRPFVPAIRSMSVLAGVGFTVMLWRAVVGVGVTDGNDVFVDVVAVHVMHVPVVEIVHMSVMADGHVPAGRVMHMSVGGVRFALRVLHTSNPF